jgi:hypothetical protein
MLCSSGGLDKDKLLQPLKNSPYLINQKFLGKKFRWHFEKGLFALYAKGELDAMFKKLVDLKVFIREVNLQDWVVSVQAPLKKADDIVNYVGRYTKRACISEYNILSADNGEIRFKYKDYKHADHSGKPKKSELTLNYRDFLGRLFEHVPSKGFRMVRYYGMYSSRNISKHEHSVTNPDSKDKTPDNWRDLQIQKTGKDPLLCPCCNNEMILIDQYYDNRTRWVRTKQKDKVPEHWSTDI